MYECFEVIYIIGAIIGGIIVLKNNSGCQTPRCVDYRPLRNVPIDNKGSCNPKFVGGYQPHKADVKPIPPGAE